MQMVIMDEISSSKQKWKRLSFVEISRIFLRTLKPQQTTKTIDTPTSFVATTYYRKGKRTEQREKIYKRQQNNDAKRLFICPLCVVSAIYLFFIFLFILLHFQHFCILFITIDDGRIKIESPFLR